MSESLLWAVNEIISQYSEDKQFPYRFGKPRFIFGYDTVNLICLNNRSKRNDGSVICESVRVKTINMASRGEIESNLREIFDKYSSCFVGTKYNITFKYQTDFKNPKSAIIASVKLVKMGRDNGMKSAIKIRDEDDVTILVEFIEGLVRSFGKGA